MIVMPTAYSPSAVSRSFEIVREFELAGRNLAVIFDAETPRAAVINLDIENIGGEARHRALAMLDLKKKTEIGDNVIAVESFWQDPNLVAQIEGVCVDSSIQDLGLATLLYETLVTQKNIVLMSDNEQYEGGKALWKKIAKRSTELSVYVLDTDSGVFFPYDGDRICYDGASIPESSIWSSHPDKELWGIVLVAEPKNPLLTER